MLDPATINEVYLAIGATDLRKSIDGLAVIVQQRFRLDLFSNCLFVFCNRNKDKIKILQWEYDGFWLLYKRLEKGTFDWPSSSEAVKGISMREFRRILDGLSIEESKAHKPIYPKILI